MTAHEKAAPSASVAAPAPTADPQTRIAAQLASLNTTAKGLASVEAAQRLAKDGPERARGKDREQVAQAAHLFLGADPLDDRGRGAHLAAAPRLAGLRVVTGLLLYNAAVGFWQDNKAANALAALKKGLALKARALRGGQWIRWTRPTWCTGDVVEGHRRADRAGRPDARSTANISASTRRR